MSTMRRIGTMAAMSVWRTYRSPGDLVWILVMPLVLSFVLSIWLGGAGDQPFGGEIVYETPRGDGNVSDIRSLRAAFSVLLIFSLAALITRGGAIHEERKAGVLSRTIACGIPYRDVVAAHVVAVGITGLIQAALVLLITGVLGFKWLAAGWPAVVVPTAAAVFACVGMAVGVVGFVRKDAQLQLIAGGVPSLLAMLGGAFFPLDGAPSGVQRLVVINPIYWSMEAFDGGFLYLGLASQAGPLAILLLVGVLGMVLGVQGLRRFEA